MYDPSLLIRIRPRPATIHIAQNQSVFEAAADGSVPGVGAYGFYVREARVLSLQQYRVNGKPLQPIALSNVRQHTWMGYYAMVPPGVETGAADDGSGQMDSISEYSLELRISRYIGNGLHEDVDLTNF